MKRDRPPPIEVRNAQRSVPLSTAALQSFAQIAVALVWPRQRAGSEITFAESILVIVVGDKCMARIHKKFCGIAGPTDVLTFQHGEIVISAQTAARQARAFHTSTDHELRLYILHGLLHLCGYDDATPARRATMKRLQLDLFARARATFVEPTSSRVNFRHEPAASR
jgi:probable rRNA maturation factor